MRHTRNRQALWCGAVAALVLIVLVLGMMRPWKQPVSSRGLQDRNADMAALIATDGPAVKPTSSPLSSPSPSRTAASSPTAAPRSTAAPPASPAATGSAAPSPGGSVSGKLNLNQATLAELDRLPGIGPAKAQAILDYRAKAGAFRKPEELMNVKGIGAKLYESIKDRIVAE